MRSSVMQNLPETICRNRKKIGEYMDKIHISGEKMLSIINNILQFSQIENNQIHIEETSVQTEKSF